MKLNHYSGMRSVRNNYHKVIASGRNQARNQLLRQRLREDPHCRYCERPVEFKSAALSHWIPRSRGGENHPSNLVLACEECDRSKGNRLPEDFLKIVKRDRRNGG
jgi:5-methylcytosine-specific restriction endonuclease McrA